MFYDFRFKFQENRFENLESIKNFESILIKLNRFRLFKIESLNYF